SIGAIVSLAQQRQRLARIESELQSVTHEIAVGIFGENAPSQLSDSQIKDLNDEITFRLKDVADAQASGVQLTQEELDAVAPFQQYQLLNQSVTEGRAALDSASSHLHDELNDKLVFIGFASTGAIVDKVHTPLDTQTPGVIVHATVADMILSNRHLNHVPFWVTPLIILALGVLFSRIAARYSAFSSALLAAAILAAYFFFAGIWSFQVFRLDLPIAAPAMASTGAWTACTALMAALNQRERSRITRQFKARVSPHLVDYLVGNPASLSVSGIQREITVLFLDIAGFTSLSEKLDGQATVTVLNRCMNALTAPITDQHGYVNKFLGDGLMAFWSAFHDDPDQSVFACRTALLCQQAIADLNASNAMEGLPKLAVRIGIATDRVIVGDCGAPPLLNDYTVIGNGVNLASRLESANKAFGSSVLVDGNTFNAAKQAGFLTRPLGKIIVVGQSVPVAIYELLPPNTDPKLIELTTEAVNAFNSLDFNAASAAFLKLSNAFGPTKLTQLYLNALSDHESLATGVLRLREK
ncbi:MAG TPA: adenylate/guanylate cyclase domain-containing protein, partial [Phycisphaerales bacterium]|nr:adenylate/guanylate cyclase domain-containing protein [Phycisphaerales bacterium]